MSTATSTQGMVTNPTFGSSVRAARRNRELTQLCLATRLGISFQYLSDIELGNRTPTCDHLLEGLARELCVDLDYLYYLAGLFPPGERGRYGVEEFRERMAAFRKRRDKPDPEPEASAEFRTESINCGRCDGLALWMHEARRYKCFKCRWEGQ